MSIHEVFRAQDGVIRDGITEASDLGFAPGEWPRFFVSGRTLWQAHVFDLQRGKVIYHGSDGKILTVLND